MDLLLGAGGWLQVMFTVMLFASLAIGIAGAYVIKARSPQRYARLNSTWATASPERPLRAFARTHASPKGRLTCQPTAPSTCAVATARWGRSACLVQSRFGFSVADPVTLGGEFDQNLRVTDGAGRHYLVKISAVVDSEGATATWPREHPAASGGHGTRVGRCRG